MILAAANDPTGILLQYGVLGIIALVLAPLSYRAYKREQARADRLETDNKELNAARVADAQKVADTVTGVLVQTRDALTNSNDYLRDLARRRS